jgi:hypothetical protein
MGRSKMYGLTKVFAFYLTDEFERVTMPLLTVPEGPEPLQYLVKHSNRLARREEIERRCMSDNRGDVLYAEAEDAYNAISTLLGEDTYFFGARYLHGFQGLIKDGQDYLIRPCLHIPGQYSIIWKIANWQASSKISIILFDMQNV